MLHFMAGLNCSADDFNILKGQGCIQFGRDSPASVQAAFSAALIKQWIWTGADSIPLTKPFSRSVFLPVYFKDPEIPLPSARRRRVSVNSIVDGSTNHVCD